MKVSFSSQQNNYSFQGSSYSPTGNSTNSKPDPDEIQIPFQLGDNVSIVEEVGNKYGKYNNRQYLAIKPDCDNATVAIIPIIAADYDPENRCLPFSYVDGFGDRKFLRTTQKPQPAPAGTAQTSAVTYQPTASTATITGQAQPPAESTGSTAQVSQKQTRTSEQDARQKLQTAQILAGLNRPLPGAGLKRR